MSDVTHYLNAIDAGDAQAAEQLLPLVYDELRKLAALQMAQEKPGQTLDATALVHEAYLRLVDAPSASSDGSNGAATPTPQRTSAARRPPSLPSGSACGASGDNVRQSTCGPNAPETAA